MLWYKSWLETRWRFLIGLALLLCSAAATVQTYPAIQKLVVTAPSDVSGALGREIRESIETSRDYRGFIWLQWFRQNAAQWATLFAILLGTAGLFSHSGGTLFTLSLPVSRARLLGIRAATGLAELLVLALVPSLLIPLLSPSIQQRYDIADALVHAACLFVAVSLFFGLAFLLSMIFDDAWRPLLITLAIAFVLSLVARLLNGSVLNVFHVMSGEAYFRSGRIPWEGLLLTGAASAVLLYAAIATMAHRDF